MSEKEKKYPHLMLENMGCFKIYIKKGQTIQFDNIHDLQEFIKNSQCEIYVQNEYNYRH